jgi:hypothetical protein
MKNKWLYLLIVLVFIGLVLFTILSSDSALLTQINIIVQLIYTFVTTLMVIFTYKVLKETKEQKNQSVRPYLSVYEIDFWHSRERKNEYDLDFYIYNEGMGLALNISVKVYRSNDKKEIYKNQYTRLNVNDNPIYGALCDIRDEINKFRNNNSNGIYFSPYTPNRIEVEVPLEGGKSDYLALVIEIGYNDIYGKQYKSIFDVKLSDGDNDTYECTEIFKEV